MKFDYSSPFDTQLNKINGVNALPWIGKYYGVGDVPKILIVGESDYEHEEIDSDDRLRARKVTAYNLTDEAISQRRPLYSGIEKALYGRGNLSNNQKRKLWDAAGYYNLCQRVVQPGERPSFEDYSEGWDTLFRVISVLRPDHCIIVSLTAASMYSNGSLFEHPDGYTGSKWNNSRYTPISKVRPATVLMSHDDGYEIPVLFMRHPSAFFSWHKWHDQFIKKELATYCSWLRSKL